MAATRAASGQPERARASQARRRSTAAANFNQRVQGSNPCTPTNDIRHLGRQSNGKAGAVFDFSANLGTIGRDGRPDQAPRVTGTDGPLFTVVNRAEAHPHHFTSVALSAYVE